MEIYSQPQGRLDLIGNVGVEVVPVRAEETAQQDCGEDPCLIGCLMEKFSQKAFTKCERNIETDGVMLGNILRNLCRAI